MAALLTKEAKDALGPLALRVLIFIVSLAGAIALYHMSGGERIPFFSDVTPFIVGIVGFMLLLKSLSK
jgi:hypothetical protein